MEFSDLKRYHYDLPEKLIRTVPLEPRDSARLFVYDTKTDRVIFDEFRNIVKYLPLQSLLVLNNTKVLPARLWLHKETGGKIEVFVLANQIEDYEYIPVLVDRKTELGQKLLFPNGDFFEVVGQNGNIFYVKLASIPEHDLYMLLETFGETPLPHYLEGAKTTESELRKRYQTIFAREGASVAAPTASLHFTDRVFQSLDTKEVNVTALTLNVGLGTFAPLKPENFATKTLHGEYVSVPPESVMAIEKAKKAKHAVIAVGTTVTRTVEALVHEGQVAPYAGLINPFIFPPYQFQVVDALITNFHLPETSLMLLVDAFLCHKQSKKDIMELYALAIEHGFSFYSFGDSMLIL